MRRISIITTIAVGILSLSCSRDDQAAVAPESRAEFGFRQSLTTEVDTRTTQPMFSDEYWGGVIGVIDNAKPGVWYTDNAGRRYDPTGTNPAVKFTIAEDGILGITQYIDSEYRPLTSLYEGNYTGRILVLGRSNYKIVSLGVQGNRIDPGAVDPAKFDGNLYRFETDNGTRATIDDDYVYASVESVTNTTGDKPEMVDLEYNHLFGKIRFEVWYKGVEQSKVIITNIDKLGLLQCGYIDLATGLIESPATPAEVEYLWDITKGTEYLVLPTVQNGREIYKPTSAVVDPIIVKFNEAEYWIPFDIGGPTDISIEQNKCRVVKINIIETYSAPTRSGSNCKATIETYLEEADYE